MLQRLNERKKKKKKKDVSLILCIYIYIYILQPIIVNNNYHEE